MAYAQTDLDAVRAAKLALATGARVVSVTFADRAVSYGQADFATLDALEQQIVRELQSRARQFTFVASKGL